MNNKNYKVYLSRKFHFSAAHKMLLKSKSDCQNKRQFKKCFNIHGHNYDLEITFKIMISNKNPFPVNIIDLDNIVSRAVIKKLDHCYINKDIAIFKNKIPSLENLVIYIWNELKKNIDSVMLHKIKLSETKKNYVEYRGEIE